MVHCSRFVVLFQKFSSFFIGHDWKTGANSEKSEWHLRDSHGEKGADSA
jgi:hypothetical protein